MEAKLPEIGRHCGYCGHPIATEAAPPKRADTGWRWFLKRVACWGAPLLVLLAIPLFWSGGWAAAGGSLLSGLALLACPVGMYFMMRGMMNMEHPRDEANKRKGEDHA